MMENLLLLLQNISKENNEKIAIKFGNHTITYKELEKESNKVASYIQKEFKQSDTSIIGIAMPKSIEQIICIVGILKSGKAYLPIDLSYPDERISYILNNSKVQNVIINNESSKKIKNINVATNYIFYKEISDYKNENIEFKEPEFAYAMYTSGSTGNPKGNLIKYSAASNLINWQIEQSKNSQNLYCKTLQLAPISFDVSFQEIFSTLCIGGMLVIVDEMTRIDFKKVSEIIKEENISRIYMPPVYLNEIANLNTTSKLPYLKEVIVAGEQLKITDTIKTFFKNNNCRLINQYGPTETHVVTFYELDSNVEKWEYLPPIGKEIDNVKIYILDDNLKEVENMVWGELYISGICITGSYLNNKQETDKRYINYKGTEIIYKTGDICRRRSDGIIEYSSRADDQIKLRGYRVEISEIEKNILCNDNIKNCAVIAKDDKFGNKILEAFISMKKYDYNKKQQYEIEIKKDLINKLPEYMIPNKIQILEELPLSPNGKINKKELAQINKFDSKIKEYNTNSIKEIFKEILSLDKIDEDENFFELGGNSILANRLIMEINNKLGLNKSVIDIYQNPTLNKFMESLNGKNDNIEKQNVIQNVKNKDIAIIGMACRFPNANNPEELWNNIKIKNNDGTKNNPLKDIENFDAELFKISPKEAKIMDPQIRIFLECVWEMFEDSGYNPFNESMNAGVFAGNGFNTYLLNNLRNQIDQDVNMISSMKNLQLLYNNDKDYISTKTSYLFNLTGPSVNVQSACSTSLVAVHLACQSLINGECEYAIAGASTILLPNDQKYKYTEDMVFSKDGNCKAFDENASGTVFSNGVGCILLKPLEKAIEDNDNIYAVIKGSAINNDGNNKVGFSAPSVTGQIDVIKKALARANVNPEEIEYIEAHGTGTKVGDAIEVTALKNAYIVNDKKHCAIGSLKNDMGHMAWTSGLASIIKVVMALKYKEIPPMNNFEKENQELDLENSPFYINKELKEWNTNQKSRKAALSGFGLGGTNAHVILEEYQKEQREEENEEWKLLTLSAINQESLKQIVKSYAKFIDSNKNINMLDVCYTANTGRKQLDNKIAFLFNDKKDLIEKLSNNKLKIYNETKNKNKTIFLFSGNGTQYCNMGKKLYENQNIFKKYIDKCEKVFKDLTNKSLIENMYNSNEDFDIEFSQIAIFSIEYALYNYWIELGIKPDLLIGHSLGEYTIACVSGIFSIKDCMKILIERGKILKKLGNDLGMISVRLDEFKVKEVLQKNNINLSISAKNTRELTVLSGDKTEILKLSEILKEDNIQHDILSVQTAGHTKQLEKYIQQFEEVLNTVDFGKSNIEIISTVTGKVGANQLENKEYWCKHLIEPVQFYNAIQNIKDQENNVIIEIGANPTLLGLAMEELNDNNNLWLVSLRKGKDDLKEILYSISQLYLNGLHVKFEKLYKDCNKISLPTYKFNNTRYWIDWEEKENLSKNFYNKKLIEKSLENKTQNLSENWIIFYEDSKKELIEKIRLKIKGNVILIKLGSETKLLDKNNICVNIEDKNVNEFLLKNLKPTEYNVLYFLEYFKFINNNEVEVSKVSKECINFINIINILSENNLLSNLFYIDIQNNDIIESNIIRNIFISLLQVLTLENSNLNIKMMLFSYNQNVNMEELIVKEILYSSDEFVFYKDLKRYICIINKADKLENRNNYQIEKDGIYILTGGLGGIGKMTTEWLAKKGVNKIILLNRRDASQDEIESIKEIEQKYNIIIQIEKVNIVYKDQFEDFIINKILQDKEKVKGIFHLAGVINDATINKITFSQMKEVLEPKFAGTWNLHVLSKKYFNNLKIFNLFSSAAAFIGNAGQVNHAIANSFLDSMVEIRKSEGLPVSSVNWGTWEKIGHLAKTNDIMERLSRKGFEAISPELGLHSLEYIIENNIDHVAVLPMNWEKYTNYYGLQNKNMYKTLIESDNSEKSIQIIQKETKIENVDDYIKETIEEILGINIENNEESLIKLGLDSLSSIEIRNKIQADLKIQLEANFIYKNSTLDKVLESIHSRLKENHQNSNVQEEKEPSCQQQRWLKLIEKKYGERVIPIIFETQFNDEYFIQSIKDVLKRHISLRWYFPNSKIKEVDIEEILKLNEPIIHNLSNYNKDEKNKKVSEIVLEMFNNMPSPYERISWMIKVIVLEQNKFAILLGVQHLDFDGSSVSTFAKEFKQFYYHYMFNQDITLEKALGYDEYIKWQKDYINTKITFDREFFKGLYGTGKITMLPNTKKEDLGVPRKAKKITEIKDNDYLIKIDKLAEQFNVSRFSIILAAYAKFISWLTKEDIITIATIINGRSNTTFKNTIGPFSAPFPLKICNSERMEIRELIEQCNNEIIEVNSRSFYPVADLTKTIPNFMKLPIETYFSDIGINYTNYKPKNEKNGSGDFKIVEILTKVEEEEFKVFNNIIFKRVPGLHLVINELKDSLAFNFYYHVERFEENTIKSWMDKFFEILEEFAKGEY